MTDDGYDALARAIARDIARRNGADDLIPRALWAQLDRPDGRWPTRRARLARALRRLIGGRP